MLGLFMGSAIGLLEIIDESCKLIHRKVIEKVNEEKDNLIKRASYSGEICRVSK